MLKYERVAEKMADFTPTSSPTDMPPDALPALASFVTASILLGFSIIVYGWLALLQYRMEGRKEADILRLQRMAQHRDERGGNKTMSTIWRGKAAQSIFVKPLSQVDMWVRENARPLKNFISSALIFFAIPNLYLLGIMQTYGVRTALYCLLGISIILSIGILFGILYYSSFGSPRDKICFKHFVAENKYEHLGLPLIDIIVLSIGQLTLLGLYMWSLHANGEPPFDKAENYMYYCLGVVMQVAYGHDMKIWKSVGHHARFWIAVFRARRLDEIFISSKDSSTQHMSYSFRDHHLIYVRFFLSHVVNTWGCFAIMMGIPIQVATQENPMDFVLNVLAGFYIVEWDDLDEKEMDYTQQLDEEKDDDILSMEHLEEGSNGNDGSIAQEKSIILKPSRSKRDRVENDIRAMQIKLAELDILKEQLADLTMQVSDMGDFDSTHGSEASGDFKDYETGFEGSFAGEESPQRKVTFK